MALVVQAAQDTSASQARCLANGTCQSLIGNEDIIVFNTLSAKDGDLRLSASNASLPKTELVLQVRNAYRVSIMHGKQRLLTDSVR